MIVKYLHDHPEFSELITIVSEERAIHPVLVEKDYWIMHCLYGLQKAGRTFFLKGGTSLSKGYNLINRFSEDIDVLIEPHEDENVAIGKNQNKPLHKESRKSFYDSLCKNIKIPGIEKLERDTAFDDKKHYRSGGIRLIYPSKLETPKGVKEGVLLEAGFAKIDPNQPITISSWMYDFAIRKAEIIDNRAHKVPCYLPGYTFVEKLDAISKKFKKQQREGGFSENFLRHYYDVYCLLGAREVREFLESKEYLEHKGKEFRNSRSKDFQQNQAFQMDDPEILTLYKAQYNESRSLYYDEKPSFEEIMFEIRVWSKGVLDEK